MGYGVEHIWTHKSGLERLPYFDDLLLPHNIHVMHTEKNVAEALWATLMDIEYDPDAPLEAYTNSSVHTRLSSYTEAARSVHGLGYDPRTEEHLDP